jgi:hypothetical protein
MYLMFLLSFMVFGGAETNNAPSVALDLQFRLEAVDQEGFAKEALASTLRGRLTFQSGKAKGFDVLVEFEGTTDLGNERYNSTSNQATEYPRILDPEDAELNRAQIRWRTESGTTVILGRQRIILDDARFIGNVGWRQNEQTFDAAMLEHTGFGKTKLTLGVVENANRIFGANHPTLSDLRLRGYLLHAQRQFQPLFKGSLFGYWLENRSQAATSHANYGIRGSGEEKSWFWQGSLVFQRDYGPGNPGNDANYQQFELGWHNSAGHFSAAWEALGGDGNYAFSTPLATLHAFNGWADMFTVTPVNGLQDFSLRYKGQWGRLNALVRLHRFEADHGSAHYGDEIDAQLGGKIGKAWNWGFKFAHFQADDLSVDTSKAWGWLQIVF